MHTRHSTHFLRADRVQHPQRAGHTAGHTAARQGHTRAHGTTRHTAHAHGTQTRRARAHSTAGAQHSRGGIGHTHPQHQTHSTGRQKTSSHPQRHSERTPTTSHRHQRHGRDTGTAHGRGTGTAARHHSTAAQHTKPQVTPQKHTKKSRKSPKTEKIQKHCKTAGHTPKTPQHHPPVRPHTRAHRPLRVRCSDSVRVSKFRSGCMVFC